MIRGRFLTGGGRGRPFVRAVIHLPSLGRSLQIWLMVDTGADRTVLAPFDAQRLGIDLTTLPEGAPSVGAGGRMRTRTVDAVVTLGAFSVSLRLPILLSPPGPEPLL